MSKWHVVRLLLVKKKNPEVILYSNQLGGNLIFIFYCVGMGMISGGFLGSFLLFCNIFTNYNWVEIPRIVNNKILFYIMITFVGGGGIGLSRMKLGMDRLQ